MWHRPRRVHPAKAVAAKAVAPIARRAAASAKREIFMTLPPSGNRRSVRSAECRSLTACGKTHAAFERRSIPPEPCRSALRFGRNTLGPVLPVGAPPSRALSAGRLAALGAHVGSHHRLLTVAGCPPHAPVAALTGCAETPPRRRPSAARRGAKRRGGGVWGGVSPPREKGQRGSQSDPRCHPVGEAPRTRTNWRLRRESSGE